MCVCVGGWGVEKEEEGGGIGKMEIENKSKKEGRKERKTVCLSVCLSVCLPV